MSCLLVSEMNSLWISWFANISSYSGLPSSFLKVSFPGHLLWNWSSLCFAVFGLFLMALGDGFQKTLQCCHPNPKRPCSLYHPVSYVFLKNFIDSLLNLRSLLFGVNFVYGVKRMFQPHSHFPSFNNPRMILHSVCYKCIFPASGEEYSFLHTFTIS